MIKVGVTGGIGSGKSTVCKVFEALQVPVYYTDIKTKIIQTTNIEVITGIKSLFGEKAYDKNKQLDRTYIASQVFENKEKLAQLNALVHPKVFEDFEDWCQKHDNFPYILKESALTFETGFFKKLDKVILVTAPESVRIERVLKRDSFRTYSDIKLIIEKQMPEAEKVKLADIVILNDEKQLLIPQILLLDTNFKNLNNKNLV